MKKIFYILFFTTITFHAFSQVKIGNNPTVINGGSVLELESTNQGLYMPRVSLSGLLTNWGLAGVAPVGTANGGMTVYNTNLAFGSGVGLYYWDGTKWNYIKNSGATDSWLLTGNGLTTPATNFIGTTDAEDFVVRTNNIERARVLAAGNVGINTNAPATTLDVNGTINTGKASGNNGALRFTTSNASGNTVTMQSGVTTGSYTVTLPTTQGANNSVMTNNGAGILTWASPTATIANNAYFAYGTASNTINNPAGNNAFIALSGLSITVTLTANAVVWVHTDGGLQTTSAATNGFSVIDIAMLNNGARFTNGGYERVTVVNNGGLVAVIGFWSKDEIVTLGPGTYIFSVAASRNLGAAATANGDNTLVTQGTIAAAVYYL